MATSRSAPKPAAPASDCEVRDPRIRRTRQLLHEALFKLLESKRFDDISVQDLADAATVNRATFYDHYTDKYALLEAATAGRFHRLLEQRQVAYTGCAEALRAIVLATCDFLVASRPECRLADRTGAFEPLIEAAVTKAIRRVLAPGIESHARRGAPAPDLIAGATSWAIYGAAKSWFEAPKRPSADAAATQIAALVGPMLQLSGAS